MIEIKILNSLIPIMPDSELEVQQLKNCIICKNQPFSFQMAYKITDGSARDIPFFIKVKSELEISNYYTACVPIIHTDYANLKPVPPIGMYPDILIRMGESYLEGIGVEVDYIKALKFLSEAESYMYDKVYKQKDKLAVPVLEKLENTISMAKKNIINK